MPIIIIGAVSLMVAVIENKIDPKHIDFIKDTQALGFFGATSRIDFWFGYGVLILPVTLYLMVFWAYATMMYEARLGEIIRALKKEQMRTLYQRYQKEFEDIFREDLATLLLIIL